MDAACTKQTFAFYSVGEIGFGGKRAVGLHSSIGGAGFLALGGGADSTVDPFLATTSTGRVFLLPHLDEAGDVDELHGGGDDVGGAGDGSKSLQAVVRHRDDARVGLDCAEGVVGGLYLFCARARRERVRVRAVSGCGASRKKRKREQVGGGEGGRRRL